MEEEMEYYEVLGLKFTATKKEISTAYRKLARIHHPDRNKEDPDARVRFEMITKARDILRDDVKKSKYDIKLSKRAARKKKDGELDAETVQMKKDLEEAEQFFFKKQKDDVLKKIGREFELNRLRQDSKNRLEQELHNERMEKQQRATGHQMDEMNTSVHVKWRRKKKGRNGYNKKELEEIFNKIGKVDNVVIIGKKKRQALIQFRTVHEATVAIMKDRVLGHPNNKLNIDWVKEDGSPHIQKPTLINITESSLPKKQATFAYEIHTEKKTDNSTGSLLSLEEEVFAQLKQAAAKQNEAKRINSNQLERDGKKIKV